MKLKTDFVREQFPAFSEPALKRWAHFENAGGSYMAGTVLARLDHYERAHRVQPYSSNPASKEAGKMMDESYSVLAGLLNVDEGWVHIGASTTANTYTLSRAFRGVLKKGENIIVTNQDHEANSGYWRALGDLVEVREWKVDAQGQLNADDLWPLCDDHTHFVAFPHVSNIIGEINPVADITAQLRKRKILSIVDGVSYAPHSWPDITAIGADIYFFSTYKTYGAHQGVMVMKPKLAKKLPNQSHDFNADDLRKKFNPAGPDHAQVASLAALGDYVETLFQKHFKSKAAPSEMARQVSLLQRSHESKLLAELMDGLQSIDRMQIVGSSAIETRVPTVSLYDPETTGRKLAKKLSKRGVMAAGGDFYAPRILKALDIDPAHGVLRVSFVHYNTQKEISKLLKALRKMDD